MTTLKLSFAKRLTLSYLFVVIVTLFFTGLYLTPRLEKGFHSQLEHSLSAQTTLMANTVSSLPDLSPGALTAWVAERGQLLNCRITIIDKDGRVLADSERTRDQLKTMENHATRPEIQAAIRTGYGQATRHSATLNEDMLYVAAPIQRRAAPGMMGVMRVALPLTEVRHRVAGFQKDLLFTGAFGIALALGVALLSVRRIIRPLEELMSRVRLVTEASLGETSSDADEFRQLAGTIDGLAGKIADKVDELGREKSQLAAILDALLEGVIAADHRGRILFVNPAAERLFGVTQSGVAGRPFLEGLRHSSLTDVLSEGLQTRQQVTREITVHTPHEHVLRVHARAVDYGNGMTGVLAALHDITEVRRLERMRQEFFANVSHELKTPLTSIKGFVETLLDGALEDPQHNRAFLETINEQANRLMRLIEDVLDLSAIEARRVTYAFESVELRGVAERLFTALAPQARAQDIQLKLEIPESLPTLRADREKLAQILMNLLDNAIKFNRKDGHVTLRARVADDKIVISVIDDGPGIPSEDLPRVFERFYRGDKSHSQTVPGTGLGLAIVKHLVEAHEGRVTVESRPGQGAAFHITLSKA